MSISAEAESVLEKMLQANATGAEGEDGSYQPSVHSEDYESQLSGLQALKVLGLVDSSEWAAGISAWTFSAKGRSSLCQVAVLHDPASLLRLPASRSCHKDLDKMTVLELVMRLREEGFDLEVQSKDLRAEPAPFNLSSGRPKKWYMRDRAVEVSRNYLLALLSPDILLKKGHGQVKHLQKAAYYNEPPRRTKDSRKAAHGLLMISDAGTADALQDVEPEAVPAKAAPRRRAPQRAAIMDANEDPNSSAADANSGAKQPSRLRGIHEKSFRWGAALMTFKSPKAYQVTCPRVCTHRSSAGKKTACAKTRSFEVGNAESEALVIRELKFWVCQAFDFASRTQHDSVVLRFGSGPLVVV